MLVWGGNKDMRISPDTKIEDIMVGHHKRATFLLCIPSFSGMIPVEVVMAFARMQVPVNGKSEVFILKHMEIGKARNAFAQGLLDHPPDKRPAYLFMLGDDMVPPWDGLVKLYDEAYRNHWDVLAGVYYWRGEPPVPLCWRNDVVGRPIAGVHYKVGEVIDVDVCGMDFTLIRADLLAKMKSPWFQTGPGETSDGATCIYYTEDVYFCRKAKELYGAKIGVHTGVRVAHQDLQTGIWY